jgi:hypothetical protein
MVYTPAVGGHAFAGPVSEAEQPPVLQLLLAGTIGPSPAPARGSVSVAGMATPGTYRTNYGSGVEFAAAVDSWAVAAIPVLERVARSYHATIHL